jgi:peptidoglycan/LPS O-acetylase OafA/YrhL
VAVIPVLLFHAGLPGFSGGFLGVDIFFVISGFLITSILLREAVEGRFSILAFYNRRVRRIFPALFAMLFIVTGIAALVLAPQAFKSYGESLVATTLFSSNILFWLQTGYFDTSALEKPLLHTWSLAVEEQFYLIWPLVLGAFFRLGLKKYLLPALSLAVCASFLIAALWPSRSAVFYMPVTRAWELGLGALLAIRPTRLPSWTSVPALAAIVGAVVMCDEDTPLVVASGIACLGTAALICTEGAPANRLLSLTPCVGIGLISYSLYLWHWPLLAFAHYEYAAAPPVALRLVLLAIATGLAYLSYRFVETPLRRPGRPKVAFLASAAVVLPLIGMGVSIEATNGFPLRYGQAVAAAERQFNKITPCVGCSFGNGADVVLWGDSYAMAAQAAVRDFASREGLGLVGFTRSACPPLIGARREGDKGCRAFQQRALNAISKLNPKLIILIARWSIASETTRFGSEVGPPYFLVDAKTQSHSIPESRRALSEGLARTVATLIVAHPSTVIVIVGQAPDLGRDAERCMIAALTSNQCAIEPPQALPRLAFSEHLLANIQSRFPTVRIIYLSHELCRYRACPTEINGQFIHRDPTHLTDGGAMLLLEPGLLRIWDHSRRPL